MGANMFAIILLVCGVLSCLGIAGTFLLGACVVSSRAARAEEQG